MLAIFEDPESTPKRWKTFRPILSVTSFNICPQYMANPGSIMIYGNQCVYYPENSSPNYYIQFLRDRVGTTTVWAQLHSKLVQDDSMEQVYIVYPFSDARIVASQCLTLLAAGYDPLKGNWLRFAGTNLQLFQQPDWYLNDDPPDVET